MYVQKLFSPWICVMLIIYRSRNIIKIIMCINFPKNFKELETIDKQAKPYVNFICVSHNMQKK